MQREKVVAHLLAGAAFGELALMQVSGTARDYLARPVNFKLATDCGVTCCTEYACTRPWHTYLQRTQS